MCKASSAKRSSITTISDNTKQLQRRTFKAAHFGTKPDCRRNEGYCKWSLLKWADSLYPTTHFWVSICIHICTSSWIFFFFTSTCSWVLDGGRKWECLEKIPQTGPKPGIAYWDTCPPTLVTHSFGRINAPALTDRATDRLAVSYWLPLWPADYWPPALTSWATDHRPDQQKNYRRP